MADVWTLKAPFCIWAKDFVQEWVLKNGTIFYLNESIDMASK
jgi:hypothetical protein